MRPWCHPAGGSLLGKVIYELRGPNRRGKLKLFRKPWAATFLMFLGEEKGEASFVGMYVVM